MIGRGTKRLLVAAAVLSLVLAGCRDLGSHPSATAEPTLTALPTRAQAVSPSWTPTASPELSASPDGETLFHTPEGLRFADETTYESELDSARTLQQEDVVLRQFMSDYDLTLWMESGTPSSYAQQSSSWDYLDAGDATELKTYAALFIDEWAKYPKAWIRVSGVTTIAFVKDLVVSGSARYAMPDPVGKALYLDVGAADTSPANDYDYARGVVHHEFDHDIEYDLVGTYGRADPEWTSFDPAGFEYGSGGSSWYDGQSHENTVHPEDGFVDAYAQTGIEEDKAETYSYLFVDGRYKQLQSWIETDSDLAGKVAEYKAFIESKVPMMDDAYFAEINP